MEPTRRPTPRSNQRARSAAGSTSRPANASNSRAGPRVIVASKPNTAPRLIPRLTPPTPKTSIPSTSDFTKELQKDVKEEEHEVKVSFKGLPCTCKNCGVTFSSYHDYYCHLIHSPHHAQAGPPVVQPPLDLDLKLASSSQPNVDLQLRLRPPTDE